MLPPQTALTIAKDLHIGVEWKGKDMGEPGMSKNVYDVFTMNVRIRQATLRSIAETKKKKAVWIWCFKGLRNKQKRLGHSGKQPGCAH